MKMGMLKSAKASGDKIAVYGLGAVLVFAGFLFAYQFVEPAPPNIFRMTTGGKTGAYFLYGNAYADRLAVDRVTLKVLPSGGSIENLQRLVKGDADVAFVQGGTGNTVAADGLMALGSVYYEPFWVFTRPGETPPTLAALRGKKIAIGGDGSGTRAVALQLLAANGVDGANATLSTLSGEDARAAVKGGTLDVLMTVSSPSSPFVRSLLGDTGLVLMNFARADAYTTRMPFLSSVVLPRGTIDLKTDVPARDITLVAPAATLVARDDLHPALVTLLLRAISTVHQNGGVFEKPGTFPTAQFTEFPLSDEAQRFYRSGPPFLERYLPFWAANLLDRLKVMLIPLLTLLLPLGKVLPPLYRWRIRSSIYRWYKDLLAIESRAHSDEGKDQLVALRSRLNEIEADVQHLSVPLSYADAVYSLRMHIALVRETLNRL